MKLMSKTNSKRKLPQCKINTVIHFNAPCWIPRGAEKPSPQSSSPDSSVITLCYLVSVLMSMQDNMSCTKKFFTVND